jgi:hypothetical protein
MCSRPSAGDLSWQVLQPVRPATPDRLGDRLAVAVVGAISSPCTIWPQDSRIPPGKSTRPPAPAGLPAARTGHHRLPRQQQLPRLGCVTQTHHDRGSRTYAVIRLTCASNPTVTNYCCRT